MIKKTLLLALLSLSLHLSYAQTKLPHFFSSNMVLQQNEQVTIWGTDKAKTTITIKANWGKTVTTTTNSNGKWRTKLPTPSADGKEYTLSIKGSETITLQNVVLGEVWFASGQSNMEMFVSGGNNQPINNNNQVILHSRNRNIRMFSAQLTQSQTPKNDINGKWEMAEPATVQHFSAVAYFFAKELESVLDVPIGIILSSWGGTPVEAWMDSTSLAQYPNYHHKDIPADEKDFKKPTRLYNAMIHPFLGFTIKGTIWYQGESNWAWPKEYRQLFPDMISLWREKWQQSDFPFYFVQTAPLAHKEFNTSFLREAQLHTMQTVKNTGMAVILDVGECYQIHPREKKTVGQRLSYWAFVNEYKISGVFCCGPTLKEWQNEPEGKMSVTFENCPKGITTYSEPLEGFQIAGADKVFYPAKAHIKWNTHTVIISSKQVTAPVAVRYAFTNCDKANLYNTFGLPASTFRTDDWEE